MSIVSSKPTITRKELESVLDCLISERLEPGEAVKNLEVEIANLTGVRHALAVNSLTAAYHLAFLALDIQRGDEIVLPSYFEPAALSALRQAGGTPVLADVAEGSLFSSVDEIKTRITDKTRAIVVAHTFGFHAPMGELREIGVPLIEDASHAIGSECDERPAGQSGAISVISFAPSMVITTGNGGMVLTDNSRYFSAMRELRGGPTPERIGFDYTMTDFQAAMGLSQLSRLPDFIRRRREIARAYLEALKTTPHRAPYAFGESFVYQSFPILFDAPAEKIEKYWKKSGIEVLRPLPVALHAHLSLRALDYPHSDRLSKKLYALPIYPTLTRKEIEKITRALGRFV